jgi:hypothetical protein
MVASNVSARTGRPPVRACSFRLVASVSAGLSDTAASSGIINADAFRMPILTDMTDRIVDLMWRYSVLTLILAAAVSAMALAYRGVFGLISGAWNATLGYVALAIVAAATVKWLCDHRDDLVEG